MANYEVTFTAVFTVVVKGAESQLEAEEFAEEEADGAIKAHHFVKTETRVIETGFDLETSIRHADAVSHGD